MLGSPIAHSRSPQLHLAAYRALGLDGWTYERIECNADELPTLVSGFGPEWVGTASGHAMVVGSGGTAPAAVVGLAELGVQRITIVARNRANAAPLMDLAASRGVEAGWHHIDSEQLARVLAGVDVVVSTIPADAAAPFAPLLAATPLLLDAIYYPWPTPLASAVEAAGGRVISGLQMLLHQAFAQVEQFTGLPAPKEAMRAALF